MVNMLSLLTFNCFGLWLPNTKRRLLTLAEQLERSTYQVVCLQEIQLHQYQQVIVKACPSYPYAYYERYIHCPKGGLLILSRLPITGASFTPYQERGLWYTPMLLDKLFYKGMLITKFTWTNIPIVLISTHLLANFAGDWEQHGMYSRVEEKQLLQLAEIVQAQPMDCLVIVVGDFNIPRGAKLYHSFLTNSGLVDPLAQDTRPTLRIPPGIPSRYSGSIDYALFRMPNELDLQVDCDLCFLGKYPISKWQYGYLSDHYGVEIQILAN
jgi:endonuclease/exonuclease/phosphatase family metal-dependent hydrolase